MHGSGDSKQSTEESKTVTGTNTEPSNKEEGRSKSMEEGGGES